MRILEAEPRDYRLAARSMQNQLRLTGQPLFQWHPPNGYPDVAGAWLSTGGLLARWNMVQQLVLEYARGFGIDLVDLLGSDVPATAGELIDTLSERLLFQSLDSADRQTLLEYVDLASSERVTPTVLQYKGPQIVAFLLNSIYFQLR